MSRIDSAREEIGWLKVVFAVFAAVDASLIAWLARNFEGGDPVILGLALIAIVAVSGVAFLAHRKAYQLVRDLESL